MRATAIIITGIHDSDLMERGEMAELTDPVLRRMRVIHIAVFVGGMILWMIGFDGCQLVTDQSNNILVAPAQLPPDLYRVGSALTIAVLLVAYSWFISRADPEAHRKRRRTLRMIFYGSIVYLFVLVEGPLMVVNRAFDNSPSIAHTARITKRTTFFGTRGLTMYYAILPSWRKDLDAVPLHVTKATYNDPRFAIGQSIQFTTRAGFLGWEYIVWRDPV